MSTVTPKLNLVKPTTLEQYALSVLNNNMDLLDAAAVQIDSVNSTANWTNFSFLSSRFTRVRIGTVGFVVAHIQALVDTAAAIPANTVTGDQYGNVVPAGYRPARTQGYTNFVQVGPTNNIGTNAQCAIDTLGNWYVRANGTGYTTTFASIIHCYWTYEWDGNV